VARLKTEGDSFYVVFTTTGSAVTCAAAILREADRYSRQRPDRQMRIGMGIHAGEPVPHEGQYVGSAVIVAARLAQSAQAGELLVTEVVRQLLPRSLTLPMEERTGLVLKGVDAPPRIFRGRLARGTTGCDRAIRASHRRGLRGGEPVQPAGALTDRDRTRARARLARGPPPRGDGRSRPRRPPFR